MSLSELEVFDGGARSALSGVDCGKWRSVSQVGGRGRSQLCEVGEVEVRARERVGGRDRVVRVDSGNCVLEGEREG